MLTLISFIVVLLILIFVHELGHFLAAKMVGVKVERFSLGFPPKAISKTIGETEYQLAWLPLGGYVKMYGEDPEGEEKVPPEMEARSFSHQKPAAKMFIILAGPIFNLVFAALIFWGIIWSQGIPHLIPVVGPLAPGGPAEISGLEPGDVITSINSRNIKYYDDLVEFIQTNGAKPLVLTVKRGSLTEVFEITPQAIEVKNLFGETETIFDLGFSQQVKPYIGQVIPEKPAEMAGLQAGDLILSINGQKTNDWQDVLLNIQGPPEVRENTTPQAPKPLLFTVERQGETFGFEVLPELTSNLNSQGETVFTPLVGVEVKTETSTEEVGLFRAFGLGILRTYDMIELTLVSIQKLITGQISAKTMGGPILIAEVTGAKAKDGLIPLLTLAAFISINLGILNLLPIPVLDGGQLVFFAIEAVRRKPLSLRFRQVTQTIGLGLLLLLMVTVFYNDISRLINRWTTQKTIEQLETTTFSETTPTSPSEPAATVETESAP